MNKCIKGGKLMLLMLFLLPYLAFAHKSDISVAVHPEDLQPDMSEIAELSAKLSALPTEPALSESRDVSNTTNLLTIAQKRKALMIDLAEKSPLGFLSVAMKGEDRAQLEPAVQEEIEKEATLTGQLQVLHVDDFAKPENAHFEYYLATKGNRYQLHTPKAVSLEANSEISISGFVLDHDMVANTDSVRSLAAAKKPESLGDQKTAVLLVSFTDSGPRPFTASFIKDYLFKGQFEKFYKEQSYDKTNFSGDVFGWFALPRPAGGVCGDVSFDDISKMVKSKKIDLKKYGRLVIIPTAPYLTGGCSFVGKGDLEFNKKTFHISLSWVGGGAFNEPSSWGSQSFKWSNLDYAMAHELGHALGIMHANGLDCGDESLYNECTHVEYGNYFDTMGAGGYSLQFNALYKELLGWIVPSRIAVLSPGVKTNLSPLESDKGVVLLKVPQTPGSKTTPYYLEYRQGVGFDRALNNAEFSNNQQGIFINKKVVVEGGFNFPQLIDATPTLDSWWDDIKQVTLNSSTFSDPGRGIRIQSFAPSGVSGLGSTISAQVTYETPECVNKAPTIEYPYSPAQYDPVRPGEYTFFSINFSDGDYFACGSTIFNSELTASGSLEVGDLYNASVTLRPDESSYVFATIFVPEGTPDGEYNLHYVLTNESSGSSKSFDIPILVGNSSS